MYFVKIKSIQLEIIKLTINVISDRLFYEKLKFKVFTNSKDLITIDTPNQFYAYIVFL